VAPDLDNLWEDLVVAILSVNNYSLEKTYLAIEALRHGGLFSPQNLALWTPEEIGTRLQRAGYDRGRFMTALLSVRLASLGVLLESVGVEECERLLLKGESAEARSLLLSVKGIGPTVLANFFLLRTSGTSPGG